MRVDAAQSKIPSRKTAHHTNAHGPFSAHRISRKSPSPQPRGSNLRCKFKIWCFKYCNPAFHSCDCKVIRHRRVQKIHFRCAQLSFYSRTKCETFLSSYVEIENKNATRKKIRHTKSDATENICHSGELRNDLHPAAREIAHNENVQRK